MTMTAIKLDTSEADLKEVNDVLDTIKRLKGAPPQPQPPRSADVDIEAEVVAEMRKPPSEAFKAVHPREPLAAAQSSAHVSEASSDRQRIKRYLTHPRLAARLKEGGIAVDRINIASLNDSLVKQLLDDIRGTLSGLQNDKIIDSLATRGVEAFEIMVSKVYDCQGLAANLRKISDFNDLLDEMSAELVLPRMPIHYRLALCIAQATVAQHEINKLIRSGAVPLEELRKEESLDTESQEVQPSLSETLKGKPADPESDSETS